MKILRNLARSSPAVVAAYLWAWRSAHWLLHPWKLAFNLYYKARLRRCGSRVEFLPTMVIRNPQNIEIGNDCTFSNFVILDAHAPIRIGNDCMFANNVVVSTASHDYRTDPMHRSLILKPVEIKDNVWLGVGAKVLPGVTIEAGVVVGAGAIVTKNVPPDVIVVGVPARVLRSRKAR